jgi:polysaccharide pyruvyl transferase WcaK-like protein
MVPSGSEQQRADCARIIQVLGYYHRGNAGDDFFEGVIRMLLNYPEPLFFLQPGSYIDSAHLTILGGGDVIKPYYIDKIPKDKPYHVLGAGLGYESELDLLGSNVKQVLLRNRIDAAEAQRRGFDAHYCPDLAFAYAPDQETTLRPANEKKKLAVILANSAVTPSMTFNEISDMYYQDYLKMELAKALDVLSEWYDIQFMSMSDSCYAYDSAMAMEVASRMKRGYRSDFEKLGHAVDLYGFDLVISMKFHGLIFSTMWGVPFVNIGMTRKTELYCREAALTDLMVEPYCFTKNRLLDAVKRAEADGVSQRLFDISKERKTHWLTTLYQRIQTWL